MMKSPQNPAPGEGHPPGKSPYGVFQSLIAKSNRQFPASEMKRHKQMSKNLSKKKLSEKYFLGARKNSKKSCLSPHQSASGNGRVRSNRKKSTCRTERFRTRSWRGCWRAFWTTGR